MNSPTTRLTSKSAQQLYDAEWRIQMERDCSGKFLCIEPISKRYFLGGTFDEAVNAALDAFPDRPTFTLRIGHPAALHLGEFST